MREEDVKAIYDDGYADAYDERFLTGPPWAELGATFEVELLSEQMRDGSARWLDVACGTGWFLSQFPDVERTGLDLSPAMVARTRATNPGIDVVEGSFLDPHDEWADAWSLVSCMWFAYGYVDTVDAVESVMENLARWTSPDGACFVPVCDLVDLTGGIQVPYRNDEVWTFGGPLRVMAVVWSWNDDQHDKFHRNLVCPHLDHMVAVMGRWFAHVEVVHYPPLQPGWGGRRALLCREKRTLTDAGAPLRVTERIEPYRGREVDEADASDASDASPDPAIEDVGSNGDVGPADPAGAIDPEPTGAVEQAPDAPEVPEVPEVRGLDVPDDRQRGVWALWWSLPFPVRRSLRGTWRAIPASLRRRVTGSGGAAD